MKKLITFLAMAVMIALAVSAKDAKQTATAVFTVSPQMTCQNCENKIKSNLRFEKGVNEIVTDLDAQTVTIKYNPDKTNVEAITKAFKKIGYTATEGAAKLGCDKKKGCDTSEKKSCCGKKGDGKGHCGACAKKDGSCAKKQGSCHKETK